jgi:hypothetical protein
MVDVQADKASLLSGFDSSSLAARCSKQITKTPMQQLVRHVPKPATESPENGLY